MRSRRRDARRGAPRAATRSHCLPSHRAAARVDFPLAPRAGARRTRPVSQRRAAALRWAPAVESQRRPTRREPAVEGDRAHGALRWRGARAYLSEGQLGWGVNSWGVNSWGEGIPIRGTTRQPARRPLHQILSMSYVSRGSAASIAARSAAPTPALTLTAPPPCAQESAPEAPIAARPAPCVQFITSPASRLRVSR
jgi:hypothetical protein